MKNDNTPARGTRDLLPTEVAKRDHVLSTISNVYRQYGYQRIETPALEDLKRLQGGEGGENEKLIFSILKRGLPDVIDAGTQLSQLAHLGLRFDLTVPLTRFYGNNAPQLPSPLRSFQFGPVWRAERPQKGRYRQFYQCDIDIVGEPSVLAEIELIEATAKTLAAVGLTGTTVRLSDRRFLSALAAQVGVTDDAAGSFFITLDKLDKIGWESVRHELVDRNGFELSVADETQRIITELQAIGEGVDRIADLIPKLEDAVIADLTLTLEQATSGSETEILFDPTLVRGMGYYTGQIFEISYPDVSFSLAGGGRYDKLVGESLGRDVPACGFSIGFERIIDLLPQPEPPATVAILFETDTPTERVIAAARRIRDSGRNASVIRRSGKLGIQLDNARAHGASSFIHLRADSEQDISEERQFRDSD